MKKSINIVCSSGPVGGKTMLIRNLYRHLIDTGYQPFVLEEIATLLEPTGIHPRHLPDLDNHAFQHVVASKYMQHWNRIENEIYDFQEKGILTKQAVILHDRGFADQSVYCDGDSEYKEIKDRYLKDWESKYGLVIHMQSLAIDKPDLYEKLRKENPARHDHETLGFAQQMDPKFKRVWSLVPSCRVVTIPNDGDFDTKLKHGIKAVMNYLESFQ
jgi:hypothetical protein